MRHAALALGAWFALAAPACASDPAPPAPAGTRSAVSPCIPNQVIVCLCGLDRGTQRCTDDARLTPCECQGGGGDRPAGPVCGDAQLDPGEACDDGNLVDGDGCSRDCTPDGTPASGEACPGQPVALWRGASLTLAGTTRGYSSDGAPACVAAPGPERVYAIAAKDSGVMTLDAVFEAGFGAVIAVRDDRCAAPATEVLCEVTRSAPLRRALQVTGGHTYHLFVDGDAAKAAGAFAVRVELR